MVEGKQYTFNVNKWKNKDGHIPWDLSVGSLTIVGNDSYYITQSSSGTTGNNITVVNGAPTIYIDGLNVSAGIAFHIQMVTLLLG